jgi:glutaredoxin
MYAFGKICLVCLTAGLASAACHDSTPPAQQPDAGTAEFAEIRIADDAPGLLYTYLLADGSFVTVDSIDQIPEKARSQVIVVDSKLSPNKRRSSQVLYVADLTAKRDDGTYPYGLVSRFKFERDLLRDPAAQGGVLPEECQALVASPTDRVILYSTDWCGVCKAAAAFMDKEGIAYQTKDIEQDPLAQRELTCKAMRAGVAPNGVPVLDVAGQLLLGFDRDRLLAAARKLTPLTKAPAPAQP